MTAPRTNLTERDGGLGLAGNSAEGLHAKIGVSAKGKTNIVLAFSNPDAARDAIGDGPLLEAVAHALSVAGGPVGIVCVPPSTVGAPGAVSKSGVGGATL